MKHGWSGVLLSAGAVALLAGCMAAPVPPAVSTPWRPPREAQPSAKTW